MKPLKPNPSALGRHTGPKRSLLAIAITLGLAGGPILWSETAEAASDLAFNTEDLDFILKQIKYAERHAAGENLLDILPNASIPWGLRTVDGSFNNLIPGNEAFGQADQEFPAEVVRVYPDAQDLTMVLAPATGEVAGDATTYSSGNGKTVQDSTPRMISHLTTNMSVDNPAALSAAAGNEGSLILDPDITGVSQLYIPNVAVDEGLSAPFNAFMTFFGQFFDHGLDLVNKGGNGLVFMPLQPDDPLFVPGGNSNFMLMTRASRDAGPDGVIGTADDVSDPINATTPHVDQQQTYASHSSSQILLRHYEVRGGILQNTGYLLNGFGNDRTLDNADDGGMGTWDTVQAQALEKFGIILDDTDGNNVPMFAADQYGNFIPGPLRGLPQLVMTNNTLVEGDVANPVDASGAIRVNQSFFLDVAHSANPNGKVPDADNVINARTDTLSGQTTRGIRADGAEPNSYDDELLGMHFTCGDGRCNENIALSTIHTIFHSEHNRLVDITKRVLLDAGDLAALNEWLDTPLAALPAWAGLPFLVSDASMAQQEQTRTAIDALNLDWNGERVFQAARFGTEMQYNRVVFDEFGPTLAGLKDAFEGFHTNVDPSIGLEFSQSVYRFGHSMLTETVDRYDADFNPIVETVSGDGTQLGLFEAFLNPLALYNADADGNATLSPEEATGAVVRGVTRTVANEIDEFVTGALQNNLVGLPLDLGAINIARGRDVGNPTLNDARRTFFEATLDLRLMPYAHWMDYADNLRHEESLTNFIAAYGTHPLVAAETTYAGRRAAACAIVGALTADAVAYCMSTGFITDPVDLPASPADSVDFLFNHNAWAGVNTGLDDVDFWNGGLAEERMPFGGSLGSTHNFVFENQLENLQNGDRFYYVGRTATINLFSELESNSFTALVMRNTDLGEVGGGAMSLNIFSVPNHILEVDQTQQFDAGLSAAATDAAAALAQAEADLAAAIAAGGGPVDPAFQQAVDDAVAALAAAQAAASAAQADADAAQAAVDAAMSTAALSQAAADAAQAAADTAQAAADAAQALANQTGSVELASVIVGADGRVNVEVTTSAGSVAESSDAGVLCQDRGGDVFRCRGRGIAVGSTVIISDPNGMVTDPALQAAADAAQATADGLQADANAALAIAQADAQAVTDAADALTLALAAFTAAQANVATAEANLTAAEDALAAAILNANANSQAVIDATAAVAAAQAALDAALIAAAGDPTGDSELIPLVIRDPAMSTTNIIVPDPACFVQYTGGDHVTIGGTDCDDTLIGGIGDDTLWGLAGNDRLEGGDGADLIEGGPGDDIITDLSGPDVIEGGAGNDVIASGNEEDVIFGDSGKDFIVNSSELGEIFAGQGDDFIFDGNHLGHIRGGAGNDWMENLGGGEDLWQGDNGAAPEAGEPPLKGHDVMIAHGGNNDMDMENGDDIMVDGPGIERMEGQLGFDWASFQNDSFGVKADLELTIFIRPILPPSNDSVQNRYDGVEGMSGSPHGDILTGTDLPLDRGNVLVNFDLIDGLSDLVPLTERGPLPRDPVTREAQFGWAGGEIILGGAGSDMIIPMGADDIVDGDSALHVDLQVGAQHFSGMQELFGDVLSGAINPGDISISRVISDQSAGGDTDSVVYSGNRINYLIGAPTPEGFIRVTDQRILALDPLPGDDGSDLLKNIERLVFADQTVVLSAGEAGSAGNNNALATGAPTISGNPILGAVLTASTAGINDADNTSTGGAVDAAAVEWSWEVELDPGTGAFAPIVRIEGGDPFEVHGDTFTVTAEESGLRIRAVAVFMDEAGAFEISRSLPVLVN
ncbi:peroxidase family protein [Thalassotalea sp. ND16A]|uniref:peroxidase family protein n=1 Tax=Thalassotalea sp. ND16A TaxID=1535422 RepID=UPI00051CBFAC|nr:peroxidase family protein [Thalassotalea sp. ND16A]KGJ99310.1 hypothetical protein ND16A_3831 [Thalassotalea sp. ND16A]